jgi:hypothetical protein
VAVLVDVTLTYVVDRLIAFVTWTKLMIFVLDVRDRDP